METPSGACPRSKPSQATPTRPPALRPRLAAATPARPVVRRISLNLPGRTTTVEARTGPTSKQVQCSRRYPEKNLVCSFFCMNGLQHTSVHASCERSVVNEHVSIPMRRFFLRHPSGLRWRCLSVRPGGLKRACHLSTYAKRFRQYLSNR